MNWSKHWHLAHAELLGLKAKLTRLEVSKESGNMIERNGAVSFMAGLMRALYGAVHYGVSWPAKQEEVERALQEAGTEYYAGNGWALEPETFSGNGEKPQTRRPKWAIVMRLRGECERGRLWQRRRERGAKRKVGQTR